MTNNSKIAGLRLFPRFLDKTRGKATDISEFPFLFFMQSRAGLSGIILGAGWFGVLIFNYSNYWTPLTMTAAATVLGGFILIDWLATRWMNKITEREIETLSPEEWDYFARVRMMLLVIGFAVNCSLLISITGGLSSPFIPFYIMV